MVDNSQLGGRNISAPIEANGSESLRGPIIYKSPIISDAIKRVSLSVLAVCGGVWGNAKFDVLDNVADKIFEPQTEVSGPVYITELNPAPLTDDIFHIEELSLGRTEDDSPLFLANPKAQDIIQGVSQLEVQPTYPISDRVARIPEFADILPEYEYIVVISGFDSEGKDMGFDIGAVNYEPLLPEYCDLDREETRVSGRYEFDGCEDPGEGQDQGRATRSGNDGGVFNDDGGIAEKSSAVASLMQHSPYCTMQGVFGSEAFRYYDPDTRQFGISSLTTSNESIYKKINYLERSLQRQEKSMKFGIPTTHVFFSDELNYMLENLDLFASNDWQGINFSIDSDEVNRGANAIQSMPYNKPALQLYRDSDIEDIRFDQVFPNVENASTDVRNFEICMPGSKESKESMVEIFDDMYTYSAAPWQQRPGDFGSGYIDTKIVETRLATLKGFGE